MKLRCRRAENRGSSPAAPDVACTLTRCGGAGQRDPAGRRENATSVRGRPGGRGARCVPVPRPTVRRTEAGSKAPAVTIDSSGRLWVVAISASTGGLRVSRFWGLARVESRTRIDDAGVRVNGDRSLHFDELEARLSAPLSVRMLELAGLQSAMVALDVASGRGEPALRIAARVARVVGIDV